MEGVVEEDDDDDNEFRAGLELDVHASGDEEGDGG